MVDWIDYDYTYNTALIYAKENPKESGTLTRNRIVNNIISKP